METNRNGTRVPLFGLALAFASVALGLFHVPAAAQSPTKPFVIYDDELKNGWQNWSWAKAEMLSVAGGKAFKVEGAAWSALLLHHDSFSTAPFSKLRFTINGGVEGGQTLAIRAMANGKAIDSNYLIQPKPRTWAAVEVPLKDIGADNKQIDGVMLQGLANAYKPYYITRIDLD